MVIWEIYSGLSFPLFAPRWSPPRFTSPFASFSFTSTKRMEWGRVATRIFGNGPVFKYKTIDFQYEANIQESPEFFSWDTANERPLFRKNIKEERVHLGVSQRQNCRILSNLPMIFTNHYIPKNLETYSEFRIGKNFDWMTLFILTITATACCSVVLILILIDRVRIQL